MNNETQTGKRRPGRPALDGSQPSKMVFAKLPPAMLAAVKNEAARRGIVPSALIREALGMMLKQAEQHIAA